MSRLVVVDLYKNEVVPFSDHDAAAKECVARLKDSDEFEPGEEPDDSVTGKPIKGECGHGGVGVFLIQEGSEGVWTGRDNYNGLPTGGDFPPPEGDMYYHDQYAVDEPDKWLTVGLKDGEVLKESQKVFKE